jgi:hypothetical protein
MRKTFKYTVTILALLCFFTTKAQDTLHKGEFSPLFEKGKNYEILSSLDKTYTGKVIEENKTDVIVFNQTENMKYILPKNEIKEIRVLDDDPTPIVNSGTAPTTTMVNSNQGSFIPQFEKNKNYNITTVYGTKYRGTVAEETKESIVIRDKRTNTKHSVKKSEIKEVKSANGRTPAGSRFDDSYYSNFYMLSENALPFEKGSMNATTHIIIENCNYAFNKHWSISTNVFIILPISLGVKCSYEISKDLYFGANVYVYAVPGDSSAIYKFPLAGGNIKVTKGDNNRNFTIGLGGMMIDDKNPHHAGRSSTYYPIYYLNFAYTNRFSKHAAFNIENFLFPMAFSNPRGSINLNLTGASIKWIKSPSTQWNFGFYGLYLGDLIKLNTKSKVIPIPYISYARYLR